MGQLRRKKLTDEFRDLAAHFLERNSNRGALITITNVEFSKDEHTLVCYLSVFPPDKENQALDFAKRKLGELRAEVATKTKMKRVPKFDFRLDMGEKNRQRIEEILTGGKS